MSGEIQITVVGALTADVELRYTQGGHAVGSFTIASNARTFDRQANEWRDSEPTFLRCSLWRAPAERLAEGLRKGDRVIAQGFLKQRSYEDREGNKRSVMELDVQEIGPSLRFASVKVSKEGSGSSSGGFDGGQSSGGGFGSSGTAPQDDPWGSPPPASNRAADDEPPF